MSELVRKGIVQASEDLQRENDEAVWQEGVLRHVPIVGSLYNWINPLQKASCSLVIIVNKNLIKFQCLLYFVMTFKIVILALDQRKMS